MKKKNIIKKTEEQGGFECVNGLILYNKNKHYQEKLLKTLPRKELLEENNLIFQAVKDFFDTVDDVELSIKEGEEIEHSRQIIKEFLSGKYDNDLRLLYKGKDLASSSQDFREKILELTNLFSYIFEENNEENDLKAEVLILALLKSNKGRLNDLGMFLKFIQKDIYNGGILYTIKIDKFDEQ